jgi:hypothetical protein
MTEILGTGRAILPVFWLAGGRGSVPGRVAGRRAGRWRRRGRPCGRRAGCGHAGYVCRGRVRSVVLLMGSITVGLLFLCWPVPYLRTLADFYHRCSASVRRSSSSSPLARPVSPWRCRDKWPMLSGHRLRVFPRRPARAVVIQRPVGRCVTVARPSSTRRCFFSLAFCCSSTSSLSRLFPATKTTESAAAEALPVKE